MKPVPLILSFLAAFASRPFSAGFFIPFMRKKKIGQSILEIGPKWHL